MFHSIVAMLYIARDPRPHLYRLARHGGRLRGDGQGNVDLNWAKEHHRLWLTEEGARVGPNESPAATRGHAG